MVLAALRSLLASYWPQLGLLLGLALVTAWKLRLLKKLGLYLASLGTLFFLAAVVTAGNPVLLLLANMFCVSGSLVDVYCIHSSAGVCRPGADARAAAHAAGLGPGHQPPVLRGGAQGGSLHPGNRPHSRAAQHGTAASRVTCHVS